MIWGQLRIRLEFGDYLLPFYFAVFVRQFFWEWENNFLAWTITTALSILIWLVYLRAKPAVKVYTPKSFWLVVGLPLFIIFALRAPFPDLSYDVLNHRLIQGVRSLHWAPFLPGDFFPTIFPFNPAPDMLMGISRGILGYRLGTIFNLLALLWAGTILYKLLQPLIKNSWWRSAGVLLVLFTEHVLFEINNYMVDLLALPLLLEATRLGLKSSSPDCRSREMLLIGLMLGTASGLKLTNVVIAASILAVVVLWRSRRRSEFSFRTVLFSMIIFLIPLLPHAIYIYRETGSPVFPLYNDLIGSPFWPPVAVGDGRWGSHGIVETIAWPFLSLFVPERLSELGVYAGRLTFATIAGILCLLLPRIEQGIKQLAAITLIGSILWSATSGYVRYAIFFELLGGVLVLYLAYYFHRLVGSRSRTVRRGMIALPLLLLTSQAGLSLAYVLRTEWGLRPTVLTAPSSYLREVRWILRDRQLSDFLTPETSALFAPVEAWMVSGVKTNGIEVLLNATIPMLAIHNPEYFVVSASKERFEKALKDLGQRRIFTLILTDHLDEALHSIRTRGFEAGERFTIMLPFFSPNLRIHTTLIEISLAPQYPCVEGSTEIVGPLRDGAFKAHIAVRAPPSSIPAGEQRIIYVRVTNTSDIVWPARGQQDGSFYINVANSWLSAAGDLVSNMDGRSSLQMNLCPGHSHVIPLTITAPKSKGEYILEIDMVQEGVSWFQDRGAESLRLPVKSE